MTILVTGGAGYIGSVTVEQLKAKGEGIVVLDDLACGSTPHSSKQVSAVGAESLAASFAAGDHDTRSTERKLRAIALGALLVSTVTLFACGASHNMPVSTMPGGTMPGGTMPGQSPHPMSHPRPHP